MTPTELQRYKTFQNRYHSLETLKKEREAEFKVAKYMATIHPGFYWEKYIYPFKVGSEERKRAVFLFALTNKEIYGNYFGIYRRFRGLLESEFQGMGISLEGHNIVKEYTEEKGNGTEVRRLLRRDVKGEIVMITRNEDREMHERWKQIVQRTDISHMVVMNQKPHAPVRGTRRHFKISDQEISAHANFN